MRLIMQLLPCTWLWMLYISAVYASPTANQHEASISTDPCIHHVVLDDIRRSPLYQAQTSRDLLCDRHLHGGWYRFKYANRSAELPTKCAPVNYCGTQAPLWLHLDRNKGHRLPEVDQQVNLTACASWSLVGSHQQRPHQLEQHCCSIEYPTVVRNCSTFLVYHLQPPHGCNMAYCAQPTEPDEMESFTLDAAPRIDPYVDDQRRTFLNCSLPSTAVNVRQFRFHWIQVSDDDDHQLIIRTSVTHKKYDVLPRTSLTVGDKVLCQVEAILEKGGQTSMRPSISSAVFSAGIVVDPLEATVYENGTLINVTLTSTMPFLCAANINANDCHLSVQIVQHYTSPEPNVSPLAISRCQIQIETADCHDGRCGFHHFAIIPVTDFMYEGPQNVTVQLILTSYGDSWWHGYQLPNVTVQVKDVEPVHCYAFTMGHVIDISQSMDTIDQPGRYLLYRNSGKQLQVWSEYMPCSEGRAMCICSVEVHLLDDVFYLHKCGRSRYASSGNFGQRHKALPQMAVHGTSSRKRLQVLESRQGKLITVVADTGARVRIRLEDWGLSVSVVDGQVSPEARTTAIDGLCNAANQQIPVTLSVDHLPLENSLCTCSPTDQVYLTNAISNNPKCDPDFEDCPVVCEPQSTVKWLSLFNYIDITDQVRVDNYVDDQLQRDSPLIDENDIHVDDTSSDTSSATSWASNYNLGKDVHWTLRNRRSVGETFNWTQDEIFFYCSNFLVNSTVAMECGQYLSPAIMKAIEICISDVSRSEALWWARESLALLEDQCEIEATYRQSNWSRDLLGYVIIPHSIIEALNCPNHCSQRGVCLHFGCVCQPGFSGLDCGQMDERLPQVLNVPQGSLCDVDNEDCSQMTITGNGFIDSAELQCRVSVGHFDGSHWRLQAENRSLTTRARFVDSENVICPLSFSHQNATEELDLEIQLTNDGAHWIPAGHVTLFHSRCRMCGLSNTNMETWPVCVDREDICFVDRSCFFDGQVNPSNSCQICRLDRSDSWTTNTDNQAPVVPTNLKTVIYDGQLLEYSIPAADPEGDPLHFRLAEPQSDARITSDGLLRWRAVSNALTFITHEIFHVLISDACNPPVSIQIQVEVFPCPCDNGGSCHTSASHLTSNRIPSYNCQCKSGYTGKDCSIRIQQCDPNPCVHGLCISQVDGYQCQCSVGYTGADCHLAEEEPTPDSFESNQIQVQTYDHVQLIDMVTTAPPVAKNPSVCDQPCQNGGRCVRRNRCKCPDGFAGRYCQHYNRTCTPTCQNGGQCSPGNTCVCKKGWDGSDCSQAVCEETCLNGGICSAPNKCTCLDGYRGLRCQKAVCKPKCRRGGKCIGPGLCLCQEGYGGAYCEVRLRRKKIRPSKKRMRSKHGKWSAEQTH